MFEERIKKAEQEFFCLNTSWEPPTTEFLTKKEKFWQIMWYGERIFPILSRLGHSLDCDWFIHQTEGIPNKNRVLPDYGLPQLVVTEKGETSVYDWDPTEGTVS